MTVLSVNSLSRHSGAPTAIINPDGRILAEVSSRNPELLVWDYQIPEITFGRKGRIVNSDRFLN